MASAVISQRQGFRSVRHQSVAFAPVSPTALLGSGTMLPVFQPLPVVRRPRPFNASDWLFELKYDGMTYSSRSGTANQSQVGTAATWPVRKQTSMASCMAP
jgi:hypothetical protein